MILKWPGGKKWLYAKHPHVFPKHAKYDRYVEPFFGGGSVFFNLKPKHALCSDVNSRLINFYEILKNHPEKVYNETLKLLDSHSKKQYLKIREEFNSLDENIDQAIFFLYLNRTCFNGVYRENSKGEFNVPMGSTQYFPFKTIDFLNFSKDLSSATLKNADFREILKEAKKGDFIYVDPPYIKYEKNYDAFRKYNKKVFSRKDLEDLALELNRLKNKCKILVSNFDLPFVKELFKDWSYLEIEQRTSISGTAKGRKLVKEALIFNY